MSINLNAQWYKDEIPRQGTLLNFIDVSFPNAEVGFAIIGLNPKIEIYKSTNKGVNWSKVSEITPPNDIKPPTVKFINETTGYILIDYYANDIKYLRLYRTTNSGLNWNVFNTFLNNQGINESNMETRIEYFDGNVGFINTTYDLFRTSDGGYNWNIVLSNTSFNGGRIRDIEISPINNNIIFAGGINSLLFGYAQICKSTNGGVNWNLVALGSNNDEKGIYEMSLTVDNNINYLKLSTYSGFTEYNDYNNTLTWKAEFFNYLYDVYFINYNTGWLINESDDFRIMKTTDGGNSWAIDYETEGVSIRYFRNKGNVLYAGGFTPSTANFLFTKAINVELIAKSDYSSYTPNAKMYLNGNSYDLPINTFLRGGTQGVHIYQYPQSDNDLFYKWGNNSINPYTSYYTDKDTILANFKTKLKSTTENAIRNPNQTKALRDTNGTVHQIHESMGGIFYSRSTNNGVNFSKEESVIAGSMFLSGFPEDKSANNNSCPDICELRTNYYGVPFPSSDNERNTGVTWQRYNPSTGKIEIKSAMRTFINNNPDWYKYGMSDNPIDNYGILREFNTSNPNYLSKPRIFSTWLGSTNAKDLPKNYFTIIPHLEPDGSGGNKIVVSARCKDYSGYDEINSTSSTTDFIIASGNITDYAVTAQPIRTNSIASLGYILHIVYKIDNIICYRADYFYLASSYASFSIIRSFYSNLVTISESDGQISRHNPDISLRNGRPVLAYQGYNKIYRIISIDEDAPVTQTIYRFPIIVRYKYLSSEPNVGEVWSEFIKYNSDGINTQQNPNVEGSKDANAYIVNFSVANSYFKQFTLIQNYPGYSCSPGTFNGKDAKLVRGSYHGNFGTNSYPTLLTLTQNGSLYDVWKQTFTITNTPSSENPNTNLVGVVRDMDINYYFNLGPIIAKNIICSPEDDLETVVENPVEFNENMISQPFSLSNGDTLIVGGLGSYSYYPGCDFRIKKFDVNLLIKSTNQLQRNLFSDTILFEDSIETEYLRGFIIDNIQNGTDSFYIQLVVDPEDVSDGSFLYSNVYSPDEEGGDNPGGAKSRYVFFEKGKSGNNKNIPTEYSLSQNYPNPFNPVTKIQYEIPKDGLVSLKVYDVLGREVIRRGELVNEVKTAGRYTILLDGSDLSSGVYFYRIESGDFVQVKRMILLK